MRPLRKSTLTDARQPAVAVATVCVVASASTRRRVVTAKLRTRHVADSMRAPVTWVGNVVRHIRSMARARVCWADRQLQPVRPDRPGLCQFDETLNQPLKL
jgi:hypothetical protein